MRTNRQEHFGRWTTIAGAICLGLALLGATLRAAQLPAGPARITVAIYSYHLNDGKLIPSKMFTGILLSPRHVATSTEALTRGHEQLVGGQGVPGEVHGVVHVDGRQQVIALTPTSMNVESPVTLLEVAEQDRQITASMIRKPPTATALDDDVTEATAVGVVGPYGAYPQMLETLRVPRPIALSVGVGKRVTLAGGQVQAAQVPHTLPTQMEGAGVWDAQERLIGVLVRRDGGWCVADPVSAAKLMAKTGEDEDGPAVAIEPLKPTTKPMPAEPTEPEPAEPEPTEPTEPDPAEPSEPKGRPGTPGVRPELAGLFQMMTQQGLRPVVDPSLLDYVQQEQADLAMCYIAAGQHDKALDLVQDIEPLASGTLAEQLNYRAALALLLSGQHDKAAGRAEAAAAASDPLVKIRGQLLHQVLQNNPRGTFHGQSLSQADVLGRAAKAVLARRRHDMDIAFDAIKAYQLTTNADFDRLIERLDALAAEIEQNQKAWPGYFDTLEQSVQSMREQVMRDEYEQTGRALRNTYSAYQLARQKTEYKSGSGWSRPGYWPSEKVDAANTHADRFNSLLKHYRALEKSLPKSLHRPLDEQYQRPVERLTLARPE